MKKFKLIFVFIFLLIFLYPITTYANMAAPKDSDIGSVITFEKNEDISVLSEVLNITVTGSKAYIEAIYNMKNITDSAVTTNSMFLSPNINSSDVKVLINNINTAYEVKSYALTYNTQIETDDWEYIVLTDEDMEAYNDQTVDTISFKMNFEPQEVYDVLVSYTYNLGGRPTVETSAKYGEIEYYLVPATMWKDFSSLTINLKLDKDMPIIRNSSLNFRKVEKRVYQYTSDSLPENNLKIVIDQNKWQNFIGTLRSPYFILIILALSPFVIGGTFIIIIVIHSIKRKKNKNPKLKGHNN